MHALMNLRLPTFWLKKMEKLWEELQELFHMPTIRKIIQREQGFLDLNVLKIKRLQISF